MLRFFVAPLLITGLLGGTLVSCAPSQTIAGVTVTPVVFKVSESVSRGGTVTVQGRYLGGPSTGKVRLGANESGQGGYLFPATAIQSWTSTEIVLTIPSDAPVGGSWLFVEVAGRQSTGLPFSVRQ